ncbi:MAG: hydroxyacid dehydrogenase [Candidatus Latescibacteria bacterium]|nr:hydroxyacid dehydrogenase [Candidatus Latescibacterota bacterium]
MANYNVLLFEPVHQCGQDHLTQNGCNILWAEGFEPDQIISSIKEADAILARARGIMDGPAMDCAPRLKVIGRHGIGVDNIDVEAATERGIHVVNTPGAPVEAVAEYVAMSLIALPRKIGQADPATRAGDWELRNRVHAPELLGKTLGIVGFGRIGRRIAEICSLGFRMNVIYSDAYPAPEEEEKRLNVQRVEFNDLLKNADYISLNVPLLESTHHLINAEALSRMQSHAILVNCSRGPVVDETALATALKSNQIGGAIIDVFEQEPPASDNPLFELDNVLLSPHYSGHSTESTQKMAMVAADIVRVLNGQRPDFPVNAPSEPRQVLS